MSIQNHFDLTGRAALVTGSSQGIGAAIARILAEAGADVAVHCTRNRDKAEAVAADIRTLGRQTTVLQADLGDLDAPRTLYDGVMAAFGRLDILVSNVAVQHAEPWQDVSRDHFDRQVRINWQSAFEMIQLFAPGMLERGWGRIVCVGSVQEAKPHPNMVVYAALKAAQTLMVENLARQFAPQGVTVNNLAPGVIATERSKQRLTDPECAERVLSWIPANRLGEAEDCAGAALLLCSDAGRYITGQSYFVDGGMGVA